MKFGILVVFAVAVSIGTVDAVGARGSSSFRRG